MRTALLPLLVVTACTGPELGIRRAPPSDLLASTDLTGSSTSSDTVPPGTTPPMSSTPSTTTSTTTTTTTGDPPVGIDVSHWNGTIDWDTVAAAGIGFSIAKATEGTYYTDDTFDEQFEGPADVGLIRGAYHFAIPDDSSGAEQADWFVDHGGGWTSDGQTLPGTLDIEWNPYSYDACYGLSQSEMIDWIGDFLDQYAWRTGRDAIVYTAASWWAQCVDSPDFSAYPLWVAHYGVAVPTLPVGWSEYTFWQTSGYGSVPGVSGDVDTDVFGGSPDQLYHLALEP